MPFTLQLTNANQISLASLNEDLGSTDYNYTSTTDVLLGLADSFFGQSDGMTLTLLGDATAFGEDTLAQLSITAVLVGGGAAIADASVDAFAVALSPDRQAFAGANAAIDFSGAGGEHVLYLAHTSITTWNEDDLALALSTASVSLMAIGVGPMPEGNGVAPDVPSSGAADPDPAPPAPCGCEEGSVLQFDLDGNIASYFVDAAAFGDDTLVDANVDAIVVAGEFSTVVALVSADIG